MKIKVTENLLSGLFLKEKKTGLEINQLTKELNVKANLLMYARKKRNPSKSLTET